MRIYFVGDFDIHQRSAAPLAHIHAAAALSKLGHDVTLVLPRVKGTTPRAAYQEFQRFLADVGITEPVSFLQLPRVIIARRGGRSYALFTALWAKIQRVDLFWSRYLYAADFASLLGVNTIAEHHTFLSSKGLKAVRQMLLRQSLKAFVIISQAQQKLFLDQYGLQHHKFVVGHSAVPQSFLGPSLPKKLLRENLGLPLGFLAVYLGNLYPGRGIEQIFDVAYRLPRVNFVIIGGSSDAIQKYQEQTKNRNLENVRFIGHVPQAQAPQYLAAADAMLLPHTEQVQAIDGMVTGNVASPLKLFEYMAAGRPIIATSLPAVMEIIESGRNGILVPPNNTDKLVKAIQLLQEKPELAQQLAEAAYADAPTYTWEARTARILSRAGWN